MNAMFDGAMIVQASGLNLEEARAIARFITAKEFSGVSELSMGKCEAPGKELTLAPGDWRDGASSLIIPVIRPSPG